MSFGWGVAIFEVNDDSGKIKPLPMITSKIPMNEVVDNGFKALIYDKESHVKILVDISA